MSISVQLQVINETDPRCQFRVEIVNQTQHALVDWSLHFTFDRFIQPDSIAEHKHTQVGSYCVVTPNTPLSKGETFEFEFAANSAKFRYLSDNFDDAFVRSNGEMIAVDLKPIILASPYSQRTQVPVVSAADIAIIPKPNSLSRSQGQFSLSISPTVAVQTEFARNAVDWLFEETQQLLTWQRDDYAETADLYLSLNANLAPQAYQLSVTQDNITICAASAAGFGHAIASLLQLFSVEAGDAIILPLVNIDDTPTYSLRGFMLDCARHFHSIETIKTQINQCAKYKINTFHWHLTDDEGWRVEIPSLPQLTQVGAYRGVDNALEPQFTQIKQKHGGFYSTLQIKEIIEFAQLRGITVIPEIDIPGHCRAAIKSLPELLVEPNDQSQYRSIQNYTDNVLNPGLAGTYQFLDTVLDTLADLFPAPYVHIGADEVPEGVWLHSPSCQALMRAEGYTDTKELQGHLLRYAERKLHALGKRMLGWEEAQHGDKVSTNTVIYSWLSEQAGLECAQRGHDVVLQPAQYTYLDLTQDYDPQEYGVDWACVLPLETVYSYQPLAQLKPSDPLRNKILGIQCAAWCELINHGSRLEYMIYPRLQAVAEAAWTQPQLRDWRCFLSRLKVELPRLDRTGIHYRDPWLSKPYDRQPQQN
jgi:hexosaminidase